LVQPSVVLSYNLPTSVIADSLRQRFTLPLNGESIAVFWCKQPQQRRIKPHCTIVYHHGATGSLQDYWQRIEWLYQTGCDVIVYDYRGFGQSTGRSTFTTLSEDARHVDQYIRTLQELDTSTIVHYGYSFGGIAAISAATTPTTHALIVESTFASSQDVANSATLFTFPASFFFEGTFDNGKELRRVRCKTLVLHSEDDTFAEFNTSVGALLQASHNSLLLRTVPNGGHTALPQTMGFPLYQDVVTAFIKGR
jgi:uncharacterized protein